MRIVVGAALAAAVLGVCRAEAAELWVGAYDHDVHDAMAIGRYEAGVQLGAGLIGGPLEPLRLLGRPSPYVLATVNTDGGTNYAAAGLSWRVPVGDRLYLRPGLGLAVHDGDVDVPSPYEPTLTADQRRARFERGRDEIDLGARVLLEPELALGWRVSERVAVEASWMHVSHGRIAGGQNPGLSDVGVRLVYGLGPR